MGQSPNREIHWYAVSALSLCLYSAALRVRAADADDVGRPQRTEFNGCESHMWLCFGSATVKTYHIYIHANTTRTIMYVCVYQNIGLGCAVT